MDDDDDMGSYRGDHMGFYSVWRGADNISAVGNFRLYLWGWLSLSLVVCAASVMATATTLASPCLTMREARERWPNSLLWWHQGPDSRCWDRDPKPAEHYQSRPPVKVIIPTPVPNNVAGGLKFVIQAAHCIFNSPTMIYRNKILRAFQ